MREGFAFSFDLSNIQHCSTTLSLSFLTYFVLHTCGACVVTLEHGALDMCKSSVCTKNRGPLCPLRLHFVLFFLVSERIGRR